MALRPDSGICVEDKAWEGEIRMRALDVFFCRSEYVLSGVFKMADVSDEERVSLELRLVNGTLRYGRKCTVQNKGNGRKGREGST